MSTKLTTTGRIGAIVLMAFSLGTAVDVKTAQAGLVLSNSGYTDYQAAVLKQASALVEESKIAEAKKLLQKLRGTKTDLLAADVMLFELISNSSRPEVALRVLEAYSVDTGPGFDIFYAFAKLAISERRWFDAFVHAQLALNQTMSSDWSDAFKSSMKLETQLVMLQSCEGRGAWLQCKQILDGIEVNEQADSRLLNFAGKTAFQANDLEKSREYFRQATEGNESAASVDLILARLFDAKGSSSDANQYFQAAIRAEKGDPRALIAVEYARWLIGNERGQDAARLLERIESTKHQDEITLAKATAYRLIGRYPEAVAALEPLVHKREDSFPISNQLALALSQLGKRESSKYALDLAKANAEQYPQLFEAWATLGWLQVLTSDLAGAKASLTRASQSGNISRDTAYFIHRMHRLDGNAESAQEFLDAALAGKGPFFFAQQAK